MNLKLIFPLILSIAACESTTKSADNTNPITIKNEQLLNYGMNNALNNKLTGEIYKWKSSQSELITTIIPLNTYISNDIKCRDFIEIINISGIESSEPISSSVRTACQTPNLTWEYL